MGVVVKNLYNVGGRWKFRKVIPLKLRQFIAEQPTEFVRWLGKGTKTDGSILRKYAQASQECEALLLQAIKRASGRFDELSTEVIAHIIANERHRLLEEEDEHRFDEEEDELFKTVRAQVSAIQGAYVNDDPDRRWRKRQDTYQELLAAYRHDYARGRVNVHLRDELDDLCLRHGLFVDTGSLDYRRLEKAYLGLMIEFLELALKRQEGEPVPTPPPPPAFSPSGSEEKGLTLREMAEKKLAMKAKSHATTEATETALRLFESVYGQRVITTITRREVANWIELLQRKPIRPDKAHRELGLKELAELYADRPEVPRLSGKSVNGHVSHLSSIWTWGRQRGYIDRGLDNPFSEQRVEEKMPAADEGFNPSQLQAIFNLPIFTHGERPVQGRGETSYWLPLLLLTYGNRPEEMCQLLVSDIFLDEDERVWCLRITDEGDHPVKGSRHLKADGNPVVRRTLPVAKRLIDLGFIDYIDSLKNAGEKALFPRLTTKGKRGYLHTSFATWWGKYLREHGAIPEAGNKPLRGFRDAWTTAAARSGLTEEEREWIQGHYIGKGKTSNRRYGVRDFGRKINDIVYKGLDLSKVRPWQPM
ncbi:hypothetical protein [Rhizobium laguerreae]|uniref:hypothetical protein n=1 Tax=Rhizobium laguerreae TaxID=1076926 RepID=UPI00103E2249|nr:hypothetical protein [Rhizobium laguerreae]TBX98678.1 hypothetical protein E0J21_34385 [Rhizobium laguerreae]